jgi:squalene-hopene/tetraprenyl-beta-curcumene cyclase
LRAYLDREYQGQPLSNRVVLLWASTKLSGLLEKEREESLVNDILGEQQSDGGWNLSSLARSRGASSLRSYVRSWTGSDRTLVETKSDGYATGLVAFVLLEADIPRVNVQRRKALSWLVRNQNQGEGFWPAYSLNKRRDPSSNIGRFMNDAATSYAVLALTRAGRSGIDASPFPPPPPRLDSGQVGHGLPGQETGITVEHLHMQFPSFQDRGIAEEAHR